MVSKERDVGHSTVVCVLTCYGMDGPVIESQWRRHSPDPSTPGLRPPFNLWHVEFRVSFPDIKRSRCGDDLSPHLALRFNKGLELHLYALSGPSGLVLG